MEYKLIKPVTKADGTKIETVTVKESFIGKDVRAVMNSKGEGDAQVVLAACATGLSVPVIENMDARDVVSINKAAKPFFAPGNE